MGMLPCWIFVVCILVGQDIPRTFVVFWSNSQTTVPQHPLIQAWDIVSLLFLTEKEWLKLGTYHSLSNNHCETGLIPESCCYAHRHPEGLFSKRQVKVTLGSCFSLFGVTCQHVTSVPYLELPANMWLVYVLTNSFLHTFQHKEYPGWYVPGTEEDHLVHIDALQNIYVMVTFTTS